MYKKFSIGLRVSKAFSAENKNKTITQTIAKTNNSVVVSDKILKINKDFFIVISNVDSKKKTTTTSVGIPRRYIKLENNFLIKCTILV